MKWTGTAVDTMRAIAARGGSFSDAAKQLGTSRDAIAGKARREGISFHCSAELFSRRVSEAMTHHWSKISQERRNEVMARARMGLR